jgi:hypothetical protein
MVNLTKDNFNASNFSVCVKTVKLTPMVYTLYTTGIQHTSENWSDKIQIQRI